VFEEFPPRCAATCPFHEAFSTGDLEKRGLFFSRNCGGPWLGDGSEVDETVHVDNAGVIGVEKGGPLATRHQPRAYKIISSTTIKSTRRNIRIN
jgi:hypothetical protein